MENIKKEIDIYLKEISKSIDSRFSKIIEETIKRKEWYKKGLCYECGGKATPKKDYGLFSDYICNNCGKVLYDDAPHQYYYDSIIKQILALGEETKL